MGEYWSDGARSMSSPATGDDEGGYVSPGPRYLSLDTPWVGAQGCGYECGPPFDLQATPVIRVVKRRNTANKKERR